MKILKLAIENYRALKALYLDLNGGNLAVSGDTGQGKTTAISALWEIMSRVGKPLHEGEKKGVLKVILGDGSRKIIAMREFTAKTNKISISTDEGEKISIDEFKQWVDALGENPHEIMRMKPREQTETLLRCVDLPDGVDLDDLEKGIATASEERLLVGRQLKDAKAAIGEPPEKAERVDVAKLVAARDDIQSYNDKIEDAKKRVENHRANLYSCKERVKELKEKITEIEAQIVELNSDAIDISKNVDTGVKWLEEHSPKDMSEINEQINTADATNRKADAYERYLSEHNRVDTLEQDYADADAEVKKLQAEQKQAIAGAKWPIDGVSIVDGKIHYNGTPLDCCGTSEQMLVCGAIAASAVGEIRVVRMDGVESMSKADFDTLVKIFNDRDIQVLSSRVSRGEKDSGEIVIRDGGVVEG